MDTSPTAPHKSIARTTGMPGVTVTFMADTQTRLHVVNGKTITVAMPPDGLEAAMRGSGPLVRLPQDEGEFVLINPAHVVMAEDSDHVSFHVF